MNNKLRIVFAGTPDFAARHLDSLIKNTNHEIVAVYTQPDRPAGRGKKLTPSAVKKLALENNLSVYQPVSLKEEFAQNELQKLEADLMVVVAYGLILPKPVLSLPRLGCINVHGSILPKWRGAAPIQRAIWAGDEQTGVTIMQMDEGLDTGDILHISKISIVKNDTSESLYEKLAELGQEALVHVVNNFSTFDNIKQDDDLASYAKKLSKAEAKIDWNDSAEQIERNIRAFNPWPVVWFSIEEHNIKVWQASVLEPQESKASPGTIISANKEGITVATSTSPIRLEVLQIPGKKALRAADVLNARQGWFEIGTTLTNE